MDVAAQIETAMQELVDLETAVANKRKQLATLTSQMLHAHQTDMPGYLANAWPIVTDRSCYKIIEHIDDRGAKTYTTTLWHGLLCVTLKLIPYHNTTADAHCRSATLVVSAYFGGNSEPFWHETNSAAYACTASFLSNNDRTYELVSQTMWGLLSSLGVKRGMPLPNGILDKEKLKLMSKRIYNMKPATADENTFYATCRFVYEESEAIYKAHHNAQNVICFQNNSEDIFKAIKTARCVAKNGIYELTASVHGFEINATIKIHGWEERLSFKIHHNNQPIISVSGCCLPTHGGRRAIRTRQGAAVYAISRAVERWQDRNYRPFSCK